MIAEKFAGEGCNVAINYMASKDAAQQLAERIGKQYGIKTALLQGDVAIQSDCHKLVDETVDSLGGLDILVSNAGWTKFTKFGDLHACSEAEWDKCWATNVKAQLHLMQKAMPVFNQNPEGGVFLITSSVAGIGASGSSMAYSVTKAAGLHILKGLAASQGPKLRINAILPGLLKTEWGQKMDPELVQKAMSKAYLQKETDVEDCADMYITAAKNSSLTGQNIQIDSGYLMLGRTGL
ncbi:MAG: hypothetical protein OHK93_006565 [Ramalina farinacea]|uniref:Uncharacterized protein n=1 Tax=Ramalina farinacea TaxID=258253 RepID=A0AA43QIT6_9LECA|nr:hypothetical protein [Ramalina farinacea]